MDLSSDNMCFYEQVQAIMEDPNFIQSLQTDPHGYELGDFGYQTLTMESYLSHHHQNHSSIGDEQKANIWNNCTTESKPFESTASHPSPQIISFQNSNALSEAFGQVYCTNNSLRFDEETYKVVALISEGSYGKGDNKYFKKHRKVGATIRSPLHTQYQVMAERKRREKLTQRFIALSAVLPNLKKMDRASVLENAIDYVRKLEERVRTPEERRTLKTVECAVLLNRSRVSVAVADPSLCVENLDSYMQLHDSSLPDIEARVSDKDVLIKIHCKNHKGCVAEILNKLEKLHLSIHKTSVLPFGNPILDITIVARMNVEYCLTTNDLVRNLRNVTVHYFI